MPENTRSSELDEEITDILHFGIDYLRINEKDIKEYSAKKSEARSRIEALIASKVEEARIEPFDFVESCEPDCTPERHAYHQGQWEMAQRIKRHYGYEEYPGGEALQSTEQDKV